MTELVDSEPTRRQHFTHWAILLVSIVLACAVLSLFFNFIQNDVRPTEYFSAIKSGTAMEQLPVVRIALTMGAIIIGIVFGALYDQLPRRGTIKSFRREFLKLLYSARLIRGLLVAPIVFSVVYIVAKTAPDHAASLIFAFQNGFFFDAVMKPKEQQL